jgi:hypothetical protein
MKNYQLKDLLKSGVVEKQDDVYYTNDLTIFNRIDGNRKISPMHVRKIELSIKKYGLLKQPIVVNENLELIDGQNRKLACEKAKCGIYFVVCQGYGLREVQILNENSKIWNKHDYLDSFCELGYQEYIDFRDFWKKFDRISFSGIEKILTQIKGNRNTTIDGIKVTSKYFQEGNLVIPNIKKSEKIARMIYDFNGLFEQWNETLFITTMLTVFDNEDYDHEWFLGRLNAPTGINIEKQRTVKAYLLNIEEIYNYRARGKRIRFY